MSGGFFTYYGVVHIIRKVLKKPIFENFSKTFKKATKTKPKREKDGGSSKSEVSRAILSRTGKPNSWPKLACERNT